MNTRPIVPATLTFSDEGVPYSQRYQDIYHPRAGAFAQARHVFLAGNGLPQRWHGRDRFVVLETGFGLANNFLATWQAWRDDPQRCERLVFMSIEQHPFSAADLRRVHGASPAPALAAQLVDLWPALTHNLHTLDFEGGRVRLMLALGDAESWLPELVARVDAFYLDGFAPARNPQMWQPRIFKALARLAATEATLATWTAASAVREGLHAAGFEVHKAAGRGGKRDITLARYAPHFTARRPAARSHGDHHERRAIIVGAGLAGCAAAHALASEGWSSTLYDRQPAPALETSGNPAGLFHGIVNAQDGTHARFNRAAALVTQRAVAEAVQARGVAGASTGMLRLDAAGAPSLQAVIDKLGLPAGYVRAVDASQARALGGVPLRQAAWFYPGGGWVQPGALSCDWLAQAGERTRFCGGVAVQALRRVGPQWQLVDAAGRVIDDAEVVVLANAAEALRLLAGPGWPLETVRGQVSFFARTSAPGLALPHVPVAGAGYVLPEVGGLAVFGATAHPQDGDPTLRDADHSANLASLEAMLGQRVDLPPGAMQGRVGWRLSAQDRLPVIGAVPDAAGLHARLDQARFVPRAPGLHVFTALGSRGITWAALGARTLASWVTGAPAPLEASLLDAIDPARFVSREARRASDATARTREGG
ncbi:MAG: bifunctional tRNA (5-methylaminomethyl-2-thiouridine)(34)-methyltransferase MnmD/FAD-dependent 5-carboxymethylaminomethyl-2-thiouridine(34) oxidoreductase MnmC [Rhizobacter sp.]|nr:bifunctional tRNA (5-methylaminomethyl-2-thiouridine)(34)-methyltransferase MnmD/FAD-dependent 5-carboxymethylaminomethyl-2-thiouridine(34) oxidoreductase MnmC [Rhizobacter sp.]